MSMWGPLTSSYRWCTIRLALVLTLLTIITFPPLDAQSASPRSPPHIRPSFAPIPPCTTSSVEDPLSSVYARLIPVHGELPWNNVSRASVALGHLRVLGTEYLTTNEIVWTHSALRQFWTFLCVRWEQSAP